MKQYQSKHTAALSTRGFYTILSLCALIIAASAWVIWGNAHRQNAVEPATGMPIIAPADSTAEAPTEPATVPQQEQEPESVIEEQPVAAAEPEPAVTVSAPVYVRPVSGAVLTPFSGDTLLFQPTMGDWRVHAGTDFSAEAGETVLALTDGTVQQIAEDGLYGMIYIDVEHGESARYAGSRSRIRFGVGCGLAVDDKCYLRREELFAVELQVERYVHVIQTDGVEVVSVGNACLDCRS